MHAARTVQMPSDKAAKDPLQGARRMAVDRNRPLLFQTGTMPLHPSLEMVAAYQREPGRSAPKGRSWNRAIPFFPPRSLKTHGSPMAHNRNHCAYLVRTFNPNTPEEPWQLLLKPTA